MLLWFAGLSFVIVWSVFRDTALDYRLVMAGAVVADLLDAPLGGPPVAHSLAGSVALLVVVMVATVGRRAARRRLLALPIGTFCHLLLDGVWTRTDVFWWPFAGGEGRAGVPSLDRPVPLLVAQEVAGAATLLWAYRRFRLHEPERRRQFVRRGWLGRDLRVAGG